MLRWAMRNDLDAAFTAEPARKNFSSGAKAALAGIAVTAATLLTVSLLDIRLGLPTALLGLATTLFVLVQQRQSPLPLIKDVSWGSFRLSPDCSCSSKPSNAPA